METSAGVGAWRPRFCFSGVTELQKVSCLHLFSLFPQADPGFLAWCPHQESTHPPREKEIARNKIPHGFTSPLLGILAFLACAVLAALSLSSREKFPCRHI